MVTLFPMAQSPQLRNLDDKSEAKLLLAAWRVHDAPASTRKSKKQFDQLAAALSEQGLQIDVRDRAAVIQRLREMRTVQARQFWESMEESCH